MTVMKAGGFRNLVFLYSNVFMNMGECVMRRGDIIASSSFPSPLHSSRVTLEGGERGVMMGHFHGWRARTKSSLFRELSVNLKAQT